MADAVSVEKLTDKSNDTPAVSVTSDTFISKVWDALLEIPGVSKTMVNRYRDAALGAVEKFSKLPHTLAGLSTLLHYNIAMVAYRYGKSPQAFLSTFTASPELVAQVIKLPGRDGKITRNVTVSRNLFNPTSEQVKMITLFDMEARKLVNFSAKEWTILPPPHGFFPLDPKIADILQTALEVIYNPNRKKELRKA